MTEKLHASANYWSVDKDPKATARAVLAELASLDPFISITSRQLQMRLYGTQKVGAGNVHGAIGRLANDKLVERAASRNGQKTFRATAKGRLWSESADVFENEAS